MHMYICIYIEKNRCNEAKEDIRMQKLFPESCKKTQEKDESLND